jgi:hypothetical protein
VSQVQPAGSGDWFVRLLHIVWVLVSCFVTFFGNRFVGVPIWLGLVPVKLTCDRSNPFSRTGEVIRLAFVDKLTVFSLPGLILLYWY